MRVEDVAHVWEAFAAPGRPLCLAGKSTAKHPEGMSVSLFFSKKGRLKGVRVWNGDDEVVEAVVGEVPPEEDDD